MKRHPLLPSFLLLAVSTGCAVASIDEPAEGESGDGDVVLDGDGSGPTTTTGGGTAVVVTTGGSNSSGSKTGGSAGTGGSGSTGGVMETGGTSATGGTTASGGSGSGDPVDPGGCTALGHNEDSGEFGTTDAACFIVDFSGTMYGWRANNAAGRTITINGEVVHEGNVDNGAVPWPGSAPYLVEFSGGSQTNTTWAFW